jgi:alpha-D-ribose 1-methylphosphonate 5-triphosphate synthase subunit PhnL
MIKNLLANKTLAAASGECVVISLKLADTEWRLLRLFALFLLVASTAILIHHLHHKANALAAKPVHKRSKHSRRQ